MVRFSTALEVPAQSDHAEPAQPKLASALKGTAGAMAAHRQMSKTLLQIAGYSTFPKLPKLASVALLALATLIVASSAISLTT
ncbi:hypothetical protein [Roseibium aggregatum]|uniref:Uncharacterized protein n=1 Tax=Roseibium aggregatum TaxID=187304 RepID=A0A0M6YC24_9HYPH|nr:hypothetical protein [Roseibium aggregatum]CTQ47642.1 hypothetical protein LAL4801_06104 [Roseibium aggregatum]